MINVPLSYHDVDVDALAAKLKKYQGRHHEEIVRDLERQIGELVGCPYVAAVQSGTAAMHLALLAAGVRPGDAVFAPTFAYVASVSPAVYVGAELAFIDSETYTWNLDPALLEQAIHTFKKDGKRLGAIIVVHNYGMPARMNEIHAIARQYNIPVVEDAAESFGSTWQGKWTGTLGEIGVYSFNSNKTITGFGGGMVVAKDKELIARVHYLAAHARSDVPYYQHNEVGFNYRMSPLNAAYILTQLDRRGELFSDRCRVYDGYLKLGESKGFGFQKLPDQAGFQPWITACRLPAGVDPGTAREVFLANGLEGRRLWKPMHTQPAFSKYKVFAGSVAQALFEEGLCLPSGSSEGNSPDFAAILDLAGSS